MRFNINFSLKFRYDNIHQKLFKQLDVSFHECPCVNKLQGNYLSGVNSSTSKHYIQPESQFKSITF